MIFIGLTGYFAKLVEWLVREKVVAEKEIIRPKYLDESLVETPAIALENVRFEVARMGEIVSGMIAELREAVLTRDRNRLENVQAMDDKVDVLQAAILNFLAQIRVQPLSERESRYVPGGTRIVSSPVPGSHSPGLEPDLLLFAEMMASRRVQMPSLDLGSSSKEFTLMVAPWAWALP